MNDADSPVSVGSFKHGVMHTVGILRRGGRETGAEIDFKPRTPQKLNFMSDIGLFIEEGQLTLTMKTHGKLEKK